MSSKRQPYCGWFYKRLSKIGVSLQKACLRLLDALIQTNFLGSKISDRLIGITIELRHGGRFNPVNNNDPVQRVMSRCIEHFRGEIEIILNQFEGKPIIGVDKLEYFFSKSGQFNAACAKGNDRDFIIINRGSIDILLDLFRRVLASDKLSMDIRELPGDDKGLDYSGIHTDEDLTVHAVRFLFHHELAHIWNGHLNRKYYSDESLDDRPNSRQSDKDILDDFCLELDADQRATHWLITTATMPVYSVGRRAFIPKYIGHLPTKFMLYRTIIAIYMALRYCIYLEILKWSTHSEHPDSRYRLAWAMQSIMVEIGLGSNFGAAQLFGMMFDAASRCETAFSEAMNCEYINIFEQNFWSESAIQKNLVLTKWQSLKEELEPHKRGEKLPESGNIDPSPLFGAVEAFKSAPAAKIQIQHLLGWNHGDWIKKNCVDIDLIFAPCLGMISSEDIKNLHIIAINMNRLMRSIMNEQSFTELERKWAIYVDLFRSSVTKIDRILINNGCKYAKQDFDVFLLSDDILFYVYMAEAVVWTGLLKLVPNLQSPTPSIAFGVFLNDYTLDGRTMTAVPNYTCAEFYNSVGTVGAATLICYAAIGRLVDNLVSPITPRSLGG